METHGKEAMEIGWLNSRIAEETIELVFVFNERGEILFGNQTAADKLEYKKEELTAASLMQLFRQEFREGEAFDGTRLRDKSETAIYRKNSSCFPVGIRVFPGEEAGTFLLLAEDITERRDMNTRMIKLKKEEAENQKARSEFIANVTHELRTPVNGISGHATALLSETESDEHRKTLETILYCCRNMSSIINNILDSAKLETGKFTLDEKEFDFYKMMEQVVETHSAELNKKELHLNVNMDNRIPQLVIGDELRLVQILNNLLSNAIKFTSIGYVGLVASKTKQVEDEVELFFMVKDSGIGISPEEQDRLFQPFSQADATITRRFGGTGLGLAVTKQLVELMRGDIRVESVKGKGSTCSFSVKLRTNQNVEENHTAAYDIWSDFMKKAPEEDMDSYTVFGEDANREELKKRMEKLVLSIELGTWDKAEMLASTIKDLVKNSDDDMRRQVLRMEMAIRKSNHEKSISAYENVKKALAERIGEL